MVMDQSLFAFYVFAWNLVMRSIHTQIVKNSTILFCCVCLFYWLKYLIILCKRKKKKIVFIIYS